MTVPNTFANTPAGTAIPLADLDANFTALGSASNVNFLQSGTGAVARTSQDKMRDAISIKDFGAVGNGVADDTASINLWLSYIVSNGKAGYVPAGTYRFTSALSGGVGSNWAIVGDGSSVVTFLYDGANTTNDIWTVGNNVSEVINVRLSGFTIRSNTNMTNGIGLRLRKFCRSSLFDVVIDGQDGNGKLWHGIRFDATDMVTYSDFECRAQKDGMQINGAVGPGPKAGLMLNSYKIAGCDVGVRVGGGFGGVYFGEGDIIANGDGVVIDNTLAAANNREVMFGPLTTIDSCSRCGVIIDQPSSSQMWVNFSGKMWIATTASHGIWIKNAPGAKINIEAYIYNISGDGLRIDDALVAVSVSSFFNSITSIGTYAINATVSTSLLLIGAECRFQNINTIFNSASNRAVNNLPLPISIQNGRAIFWDNYNGTLDGSGSATFAHGKGGSYSSKIIAVFASAKSAGGAWYPISAGYVDGTNINITSSVTFASRPYNVMCLVGDQANSGW